MNILDVLDQAQRPARDRTALFTGRLDTHLATLPDDASRFAYCAAQATKWVTDYEAWALAVDRGLVEVGPGKPSAWDYQQTIAAINERKGRYAPAVAA